MRRSRLMSTRTRLSASFTRILLGITLALLVAVPFVSPERLFTAGTAFFAPATAHAATDCAAQTAVPQAECEALLALYTATNGANWDNKRGWAQDNTICSWFGVTCGSGRVTSLALSDNQLSGAIPPALGSLTNLTSLDLSRNQLSGSLPPALGSLTNLTSLNLSRNQLSGSLPPALGSLANLTSLDLDRNQLSGSIPLELANLAAVSRLYL